MIIRGQGEGRLSRASPLPGDNSLFIPAWFNFTRGLGDI